MTRPSPIRFDYEFSSCNGVAEAVLTCPKCRDWYLHHGTVTIFDRGREDGPTTAIEVSGTSVKFHHPPEKYNPSSRRDGLAIEFWCESCGYTRELTIAQHKGITVFDWRDRDGEAPRSRGYLGELQLEDARPHEERWRRVEED